MGYNLYITRAKYWAENEDFWITADEWLEIVEKDPTLSLNSENGRYHALWSGEEDCWLDWFEGNIYTKYPKKNLIEKMGEIADNLGARVHGEDDEVYGRKEEPYHPAGKPEIIDIDPKRERRLKAADLFFIVVGLAGGFSVAFSDNRSFDYRHIILGAGVLGLLVVSLLERRK